MREYDALRRTSEVDDISES